MQAALLLLLIVVGIAVAVASQINFQIKDKKDIHDIVDESVQLVCYDKILRATYDSHFPPPISGGDGFYRDFNPNDNTDSSYRMTIPRKQASEVSDEIYWNRLAYRSHYYRTLTEGHARYSIDSFGLTFNLMGIPLNKSAPRSAVAAYERFEKRIKMALSNQNITGGELQMPLSDQKFVPRLSIVNQEAVSNFTDWCYSLPDYGNADPKKNNVTTSVSIQLNDIVAADVNVTMVYHGIAELKFGDLPWFGRDEFEQFRDHIDNRRTKQFPRANQSTYRVYEPIAIPLQCGLGFRYQYNVYRKENPEDVIARGWGEYEHHDPMLNGHARAMGKFWRAL